ncbi:MAG: TonB-dependent receptor [Bacteroidetes bacterium]|jgi:outer membrane receptor for ferrienterochelin and colicins|nr:TonB-dependent receptor [Bacteroidota bacterium]
MKSLFTIILFLFLYPAAAQTGRIEGRVECEGKPVEFMVVGLTGTNFSSITDKNGAFSISEIPFSKYELQFSMVGYEKIKRNITINSSDVIRLKQSVVMTENSLNTVVITGTMQEISRSESAIPIEILTPKLFLKNPTPSLFESMQMVNGVQPQLNCNVCNTGDIHINGMEGPYTMITIDGMPIVSALSTVYGLSGIPNSLVNRIEVVKGPASTLYGSEAVGGLINIITKNPIGAPILSVDVFATSDQEYNTDIGLKFKVGKAHSLLGINYFNFNNVMDKNHDGFTDITLQNRISIFNKWSFERKDGRLANIAARFVYEDRWGGQTSWENKWRGSDSIYGESIFTSRYELIGIYQLPVKEKIFFQYSLNNHDQNSYYGTTSYMANQNIAFAQLYWTKKIIPTTELLVGLPFRYTFYDDNTTGTQTGDSNKIVNKPQQTYLPGIFVQTETKYKKITALAGLRYDYNTIHGNIFSPRLSLKYAMNSDNIFRLSGGNGYRVVNLFTEDHAALTGAREVVIQNDLKPEKSWNANLNYQKFITMAKGFLEIDASAFYTYFSNKIIGDFITDPNKIIFDNINGYAVSEGVSLSVNATFVSGLKMNLGGTYMKVYSVEKNEYGVSERHPQLHAPDFSGNYSISYTFNKAQVTIDYTGNVKSPMHLPVVPNDYRPQRSPWFTIQNFQITKKFRGQFEIYAGVKNIFDFTPDDPILRPFDPFDKHIEENNPNGYSFDPSYNYAPMQGRRYFIGIRYNLYE